MENQKIMAEHESEIEEKWQRAWEQSKIFEANPEQGVKKVFVTVPFPYMNGPLHIGHGFTSCRVDVYARFKRMQGFNTLFPWAWHWTGQPIVAAAERLANGDAAMVKEFVELDGIPREEISKFYDPEYMARYYTESSRLALKRLGLSIDWRREFHTTDLEPSFNQFILWQMNKLRQLGYITKGTHPVVWCPRDQSPTGDHDRLEGAGVTWEEYTLVKFSFPTERGSEFSNVKLPAATFRPETIFGVTNLWINPKETYVLIKIKSVGREEENWIVSKRAASKLGDQLKDVQVIKEVKGTELVGRTVMHPLHPENKTLPILPATFVNPDNGSGVVYSVPAHAPMDYVALRDLKHDLKLQEDFHLERKQVEAIKPISLITIPGMGEFPAVELIEKMGVMDQNDPRVEEATGEIYKKEFHQGVLNQNTGEFQSRKVSEAKPLITKMLKENGLADYMYDLPEKVVCRCMTECTVKILEDQWFLKYSDPEWKKKTHESVDGDAIFPESARQWFHDVVDWIKDWPCARKVGLGTPLPWSPGWIVETLSDSTIYMAFYTINAAIKKDHIPKEALTESFFDYVFLGQGDLEGLCSEIHFPPKKVEEIRSEFLYWYPVNLRNSAKELIPNHLLFFIMQHVAFFPKELWPTGVSVNGMMMNEGVKMSKSKGNVITLSRALSTYGADTLRAALVSGAEGMDDIDWREKNVKDLHSKITSLPGFVSSLFAQGQSRNGNEEKAAEYGQAELLLESQVQSHIQDVTVCLEAMKMKSAFQVAFYDYWNDLRGYLRRTSSISEKLIRDVVRTWLDLLCPFIPYTCEEINSTTMGGKDLLSASRNFPIAEKAKSHPEAELSELLVQQILADTLKIRKVAKETGETSKLHVYLAPKWSYALLEQAIISSSKHLKMSEILEDFFKSHGDILKKDIAGMLSKVMKEVNEVGENFMKKYLLVFGSFDEGEAYEKSSKYLEHELGLNLIIHRSGEPQETYDPKGKAKFAMPLKPALYLE